MTDNFIILSGGLIQNDPGLPILDLDVLRSDFVDEDTLERARELRALAHELGLREIENTVNAWLTVEGDTK